MKPAYWIIIGLVVVTVGVWVYMNQHPPTQPDCATAGWDHKLGFDMSAKVKDAEGIETKIGISDAQVKQFDSVLKAYAQKYDNACRDVTAQRMSVAEYECRRRNMDAALDRMQAYSAALDAAKATSGDVTAQRDIILKAMQDVKAITESNFTSGCTSALSVDPKTLTFGNTVERTIRVSNGTAALLPFSVDDLPEAFLPMPKAGTVPGGGVQQISIYRLNLPVTAGQPVHFHVRANFQETELEIQVTPQGAVLYTQLEEELKRAGATMANAVAIVQKNIPATAASRESASYVIAGHVLSGVGHEREGLEAIDRAIEIDPRGITAMQHDQLLKGLAIYKLQRNRVIGRLFEAFGIEREALAQA
jgi:hypothetical protein